MGTTTIYGTGRLTPREFVTSWVFSPNNDSRRLVDISVKGNVAYCAVHLVGKSETIGVVVLMQKDGGDWNYRIIAEAEGPLQFECPARVLDRLTPTNSEMAIQWREKCRALAARRKPIKAGSVITLDDPVTFSDGVREATFTCESHWQGRRYRKLFRRHSDNALCTISKLSSRGYSVS